MKHISIDSSKAEVLEAMEQVKKVFLAQGHPWCATGSYDNGKFTGVILMQDSGALFSDASTIKEAEKRGLWWQIRKQNRYDDYGEGLSLDGNSEIHEGDIILDVYHSYEKEA